MRRGLVMLGLAGVCLGFAPGAFAQSLNGALSGSVVDSQGGVLPGANVTLTDQRRRARSRT